MAFTWNMKNLVIHILVYMSTTVSRFQIICLQVCLDFSEHLCHYVLYQQIMFRNQDKVLTCHSILVSITKPGYVLYICCYPGFSNQKSPKAQSQPGYSCTSQHSVKYYGGIIPVLRKLLSDLSLRLSWH